MLDRYRPEAVRLFYLRAQYRQPIEFGDDLLVDAEASLERLWAFRRRIGEADAIPDAEVIAEFRTAMDDDFNTAGAMAVLFDVVREGNRLLDSGEDAGPIVAAYDEIVSVLAIGESRRRPGRSHRRPRVAGGRPGRHRVRTGGHHRRVGGDEGSRSRGARLRHFRPHP